MRLGGGSSQRRELLRIRDIISTLLQEHCRLRPDQERITIECQQRLLFSLVLSRQRGALLLEVQAFKALSLFGSHRCSGSLPEGRIIEVGHLRQCRPHLCGCAVDYRCNCEHSFN